MVVSEWVSQAINFAGINQAQLARELSAYLKRSIDRSAIGKMINGLRNVSAEELLAIEHVTGYPIPIEIDEIPREEMLEWARLLRSLHPEQRQQSFALLQNLKKPDPRS